MPRSYLSAPWRDLDRIDAAPLRDRFETADPYPHIVLDGVFDRVALSAVEREFDVLADADRCYARHRFQRKIGTRPDAALPDAAQAYFNLLHSGPFVRLLSRLTGIAHLLPDPGLSGGGMHEMPAGGRFELHSDFPRHPATGLDNRLVVITYLNDGWAETDGGALELWRRRPRERAAVVQPIFGRTLVMAVGRDMLHGLPDPVRAAGGRTRRSIAAYFYTSRPPERDAGETTRYFRRPGGAMRDQAVHVALNLLPPVAVACARRILGTRPLG